MDVSGVNSTDTGEVRTSNCQERFGFNHDGLAFTCDVKRLQVAWLKRLHSFTFTLCEICQSLCLRANTQCACTCTKAMYLGSVTGYTVHIPIYTRVPSTLASLDIFVIGASMGEANTSACVCMLAACVIYGKIYTVHYR